MDLLRRFTDYLNSPQNKLSNKTVKNYRADISSFISWYKKQYNRELGITPTNITSQIVDLYKRAKIQEFNLSSNSLKRHLSSLRRFFQFLKTQGLISQDPFEEMKNLLKNELITKDKWHLQAFKNYLYLYNKSNLTIKNYTLDARHFLTWVEQVTNKQNVVTKINDALVSEYKKRLLNNGFSPRTINRKLSSIRQYLKYSPFAKREELIKTTEVQPKFSNLNILSNITWRLKGKPIFLGTPRDYAQKNAEGKFSVVQRSIPDVSSIPKEFYAPLAISTRYFSWYKKIFHYIRHKRPNWYKKYQSYSIIRYFHLALLILFTSQLVFVINKSITPKSQNQTSVLGTLESKPAHFLSFKGKLTDSSGNPIKGSATPVRMSIYNDETASGSSLLWQEVVDISTNKDGKFSTTLGNNIPLPQNLFVENQALWLGVSVGQSPELIPRDPIAMATFATNAEKLQGLSLITSPNGDTKNVILALDSSGNLTIDGYANPTFQSTGGTFTLLGQTLVLSTTPGTNTNVEIQPMDLGKIDLQKPIFNSTENNNVDMAVGAVEINDSLAVLATTSATSAFTINQDSIGPLIIAYTNGSPRFVVDNNGRLGIGTTLPSVKVDVEDNKDTAIAQIFNTNIGTTSNGLVIKLGNSSNYVVNNTNHFIDFDTSGIGIVGSIRGSGGNGIQYQTSGIADFAEYLNKDENKNIEFGSIVCIDEKGEVTPCDNDHNKIIGVASEHPAFLGGENLGNKSIAVALVGQVSARVSSINGSIKPGDPLTSSSISGVAARAIQKGQIVGKAMEPLSCHPEDPPVGGDEESHGILLPTSRDQNDNVCQGNILVVISVSWYNPPNDTIVSPIAEIDKVHTNIVSPLTSNSITLNLNNPSESNSKEVASVIQNASGSAEAKSDLAVVKDSTPSAQYVQKTQDQVRLGQNIQTIEPSEDLTIRLSDPSADELISPMASGSPILLSIPKKSEPPIFLQGLMSFGPTSLTDVSVIGQISIGEMGSRFIISENSINVIGAVLELQPLRQGALSLMGGLVYLDTNGDLKVHGNAEFAKDVKVGGDLVASGSGTFNKLNLKLAKNALALSKRELIATGAAGVAYVPAHEIEVTIRNIFVTDKSLIYITPVGTPSGQIPFLMRQAAGISFTVGVSLPSPNNIPFNFLIIN